MRKHIKKTNTFKLGFIILFSIVSIIILSLQIYVTKYFVGDIILKKSQDFFEETVFQISRRVDLNVSQASDLVMEIRQDQRIKNYLIEMQNDRYKHYTSKYKITREILQKLNIEIADNIYLYTIKYQPINCFYSVPAMETPNEYKKYLGKENSLIGNGIKWEVKNTSPYTLEAITYIKNGSNILGLLVIEFSDVIFSDIFENYGEFDGGTILLQNSSNDITYCEKEDEINQNIYNMIGTEDIIIKEELKFSDWYLVGILNRAALDAEIDKINGVFIIVFAIMFVAIMTIPIIISKSVIKPMDQIVHGMQNVQNGNYNFEIENNAKNEFRIIIDNFNFMVRRIRGLIDKVIQQERNYRQAEMQALKSKLNPHFLYNTLDMINWMLVLEEQSEIAEITVLLSDILRYSITYDDDFVTIREDLRQITNYLTIQKLRFGRGLDYSVIIDDQVLDYKIPKLLIQPLVENTMKHAFVDMKEGNYVYIEVEGKEDDFIYFVVQDNGIGMTNEELDKILKGRREKGENHSFGIELVRNTIKYTYGNECGLIIESEAGRGTKIIVKIKKHIR